MHFLLIPKTLHLIETKLMNDNIFLDTNILVYSYSNNEPNKQTIARKLMEQNYSFISTQVLQELVNIATRKLGFSYNDAINAINECVQNNTLYTNTNATITKACSIATQYKTSFYDSLIIAAALLSNCTTLYTEDLHNGLIVDNILTVKNPFVESTLNKV
jgi:predicted nucleic acid-binding protein